MFSDYKPNRFAEVYLLGGVGFTSFDPVLKTLDSSFVTYGTVGKKNTGRINELAVPLGLGASFRITDNMRVNVDYLSRLTLNDDKMDYWVGNQKHDWYSYLSLGVQFKLKAKDTDRDGIPDKTDMCVETPGKKELAGCPDKDNDGIADKDDACPDVAGKAEFKGCPDTDGDGIPDKDDICPTTSGKKELGGCPDKDGDGIADKDDKCPDAAGKKELAGCPDKDGDGVIDSEDACPDVKGSSKFAGCPDSDGDGIPDNKDKCPDKVGVAANNGCPEENKEANTGVMAGAVIGKIVYFDTDESIVLAKNIIDLNEIAAYMNEHPDATIAIAGHTDSRESVEYNLRLSERRADYVIAYLKKKGMKTAKLDKSFFGKSKPAADNSTPAGMALNRRVEIKVTKP